MKRYKVCWTEYHEEYLEANNEDEAVEGALYGIEQVPSFKESSIERVECEGEQGPDPLEESHKQKEEGND